VSTHYLPVTGRRTSAAMMVAGALVGWLVSPLLWLVAGPLRWSAIVLGTAKVESGFDKTAVGDGDASVGVLQFNQVNADLLSVAGWALSPWWSGYAAARYAQRRIMSDPWGAALARMPYYGPRVFRCWWRTGGKCAGAAGGPVRDALYTGEAATWRALGYMVHPLTAYMGAAAVVAVLAVAGAVALVPKRRLRR